MVVTLDSSLVGLAMTIVFLPVPSYFARKLSEVQKSKMNLVRQRLSLSFNVFLSDQFLQTDARVEEISERKCRFKNLKYATISRLLSVVNVLRTIKLLGWEWKMGERVREKREAELRRLWQTLVPFDGILKPLPKSLTSPPQTLGLLNASMKYV